MPLVILGHLKIGNTMVLHLAYSLAWGFRATPMPRQSCKTPGADRFFGIGPCSTGVSLYRVNSPWPFLHPRRRSFIQCMKVHATAKPGAARDFWGQMVHGLAPTQRLFFGPSLFSESPEPRLLLDNAHCRFQSHLSGIEQFRTDVIGTGEAAGDGFGLETPGYKWSARLC
jgi:hypothetical protein